MASSHASWAGLSTRLGSGVSSAEGAGEAEAAMALLQKAIGQGFRTYETYHTEDALDPLRGREDFKLLMMDLAFPAEPFSAAR
jgi:hypothetical protein